MLGKNAAFKAYTWPDVPDIATSGNFRANQVPEGKADAALAAGHRSQLPYCLYTLGLHHCHLAFRPMFIKRLANDVQGDHSDATSTVSAGFTGNVQ